MSDTTLRSLIDDEELDSPFWKALENGKLLYARCHNCGNAWLPSRPECPSCLQADWAWQEASGSGTLISWVVYHVAYHEAFADRVPYNVAVVELEEGPRMITNLTNLDKQTAAADAPVALDIQSDGGLSLARFRLT